jgi:chlorobactene glucosyltransferase
VPIGTVMTSGELVRGVAYALPWYAVAFLGAWRWRRSPSLDAFAGDAGPASPLVSVIVPARDEARHIGACVSSILGTSWPSLELIVVDDHSSDGTGALARAAAGGDARLRILTPSPPPDGWLGKQWACHAGADAAQGTLLCFTDADTRHAPDLLPRAVAALDADRHGMLSVFGHQEMVTFWERAVQPQMFAMLAVRYGGPGAVNRSTRAHDRIANGQFLLFTRAAYQQVGGHAAVRGRIAEDLALAQRCATLGVSAGLYLALSQLSTRMYASLRELAAGWGKNIYAGGRESLPGPAPWRAAATAILLPVVPLLVLAPPVVLAAGLVVGATPVILAWSAAASLVTFRAFAALLHRMGHPRRWAALAPLGALAVLAIAVTAIARGRRVRWKGRGYRLAR